MILPENIYANKSIWAKQVRFRNMSVYKYTGMHAKAMNKKRA